VCDIFSRYSRFEYLLRYGLSRLKFSWNFSGPPPQNLPFLFTFSDSAGVDSEWSFRISTALFLLLGAELPLVVESFDLLNDIFPFPSILDAGYPVFNIHLANILFDIILPSVLGSSL